MTRTLRRIASWCAATFSADPVEAHALREQQLPAADRDRIARKRGRHSY